MKSHIRILLLLLAVYISICFSLAVADIIRVPEDYNTISKAISQALLGDTIHVAEGEFSGDLKITSWISLIGAGKDKTIIKGSVEINSPTSISFQNVTITKGLRCIDSSPSIKNLSITGGYNGYGIYARNSGFELDNFTITNCGQGIRLETGSIQKIHNGTISNLSSDHQNYSYGIYVDNLSSSLSITNVTLTNLQGSAIYVEASDKDIDIDFTDVTINDCKYGGIKCDGRSKENTNCRINNVTITRVNRNYYAIDFSGFSNVNINKANISDSGGINCSGTSKENTNCRINNVTTTSCDGVIRGSGYSNVNIDNVTMTDGGSHGINCSGTSNTGDILNINKVTITDGGAYGIYCRRIKTAKVRNSVIGRNANPGIYFKESETGDFGTADDPGNNQIFRNRQFLVQSDAKVTAIGNWWGMISVPKGLFTNNVVYEPYLKAPPGESGAEEVLTTCLKGDVNGDQLIKSIDASLALRIAAQLIEEPTEAQKCGADMNEDGLVKSIDASLDASLILRQAAGLNQVVGAPPLI